MNFKEIFHSFEAHKKGLKVVSVASCDADGKPNCAHKMLVDVAPPNHVYFLDYQFTQTHHNVTTHPQLSIAFMDDAAFTGYRLTGTAEIIESGKEFEAAKKSWEKRLIGYEADRIIKRVTGQYSTKEGESNLPKNFLIVKFTAHEGSVVKPDRVLRAKH